MKIEVALVSPSGRLHRLKLVEKRQQTTAEGRAVTGFMAVTADNQVVKIDEITYTRLASVLPMLAPDYQEDIPGVFRELCAWVKNNSKRSKSYKNNFRRALKIVAPICLPDGWSGDEYDALMLVYNGALEALKIWNEEQKTLSAGSIKNYAGVLRGTIKEYLAQRRL